MHFAELSDAQPGERVFDVRLQGKTVAEGLDVVARAGGASRALTQEFRGIEADTLMTIEWVPRVGATGKESLPIVNGIELIREQ